MNSEPGKFGFGILFFQDKLEIRCSWCKDSLPFLAKNLEEAYKFLKEHSKMFHADRREFKEEDGQEVFIQIGNTLFRLGFFTDKVAIECSACHHSKPRIARTIEEIFELVPAHAKLNHANEGLGGDLK